MENKDELLQGRKDATPSAEQLDEIYGENDGRILSVIGTAEDIYACKENIADEGTREALTQKFTQLKTLSKRAETEVPYDLGHITAKEIQVQEEILSKMEELMRDMADIADVEIADYVPEDSDASSPVDEPQKVDTPAKKGDNAKPDKSTSAKTSKAKKTTTKKIATKKAAEKATKKASKKTRKKKTVPKKTVIHGEARILTTEELRRKATQAERDFTDKVVGIMKETTDVKRLSELSKLTMAMLDEREKIDAMDDVKKQKNAYREYITKIQQYIAQKTSSDSTQNVLRTGVDNDTIEDTKSNNTNTTMKPEQFINAPTPDKQSIPAENDAQPIPRDFGGVHNDEEVRFDREVKRRAESSVSESTSQKQDDTGEFLGMRNDEEVRFDYAAEEREKSSQDLAPQDAEKSMAAAAQETPKPQENNAESASQEDVSADENVQENNEATREQLLANLADARTQYARLHFKNEGMMNKIKAAFGSFDTAGDNDLSDAKKSYQDAYRKYRDDMMAEIETLPPQEQKAALLELKKTDDMEGINLYDARVAVKAESRPFGQKVYDLVMKYKELDWQAKLIISGTIFGAGMAVAGTGGFAAGAVGVLAGIKRGLGAGVMGAGVTGVLEAKAQKDERARSQESLAAFRALDAVQQKEILASFDNQSLQDIEGKFHDKIRGRSRRVMAGILTTAAAMTFGLSRAFGMDAVEAPHVEGEHPSGVDDAQASVTEQPAAQMPTQEVPVQEVPSAELILETGSGALVVEEGGSVEGALIKFFVQNHEKLTEGGMGWDPERFNSVEEWAGKRAHGLVKEYMTERSGVDMNLVRPGTEIKIDAHDLKNITITDVDFEHIVPTGEKIMNEPSILETLRTPEEIRTAFGITQEEYNMYQKTDAQRFVNESMELPEHIRTPLQNHLISLQEQGTSLGGRTVSEFLDNTRINILDEAPDATDVVQDAAENVVEHTVSEAEFISTLMGNPQFLASVREQIQNLTDNPAMGRMLSNVKMQSLGNFNPEAAQQMDEIRQRAQEHLGDRMVMPKENPTVGTYMTRLFARAVQEGKVQDIFPGSRYQL